MERSRRTRLIVVALIVVIAILVVRTVFGDAIQGFLDGVFAGSTNGA